MATAPSLVEDWKLFCMVQNIEKLATRFVTT